MTTITLKGNVINTSGKLPAIGSKAPDFTMTRTDLSELRLSDTLGKETILNIFPSLDTGVCAAAMKRFNDIASNHKDILILCVSADLPFAQKRFCVAEHLDNVVAVSIFRNTDFGKTYGVQIIDGPLAGLLSRAVVVLDKDGMVTYTEQVGEIADEPNYDAALNSLTAKTLT